jgi:aspartyl/glutamyl-tRNA(Asn/Gln) amidotransferase C subunit
MDTSVPLTTDQVRTIAKLARLSPPESDIPKLQHDLAAILTYIEKLRQLDLKNIEPLTHIAEETNRLDSDLPGPTIAHETLMRMSPESAPPFIKVPKIL